MIWYTKEILVECIKNGILDPEPVLLIVDTGENRIGRNNINHWDRLECPFKELGFQSSRSWVS